MNLREIELSKPVMDYFESLGYRVYCEIIVPKYQRKPDILAVKGKGLISIELKTFLTKLVIKQAYDNRVYTDYSYVAIPTNPSKKNIELCKKFGIGVIKVGKNVDVILDPKKNNCLNYKKNLLQLLKKFEAGGTAGYPVIKGEGQAIECAKRILEYRKQHPLATWKEIWENVPNHYSNHFSMTASLMRK